MVDRLNLEGRNFGLLFVLAEDTYFVRKNWERKWFCVCSCGTFRSVLQGGLLSGNSLSCGCTRKWGKLIHGQGHGTSEYRAWHSMRQRCLNPRDKKYPRYGGRGIEICAEWSSFKAFFKDMGSKPSPKHSLERTNNNEGYSPDNCVWALPTSQARNRSNNVLLEFNGEVKTLSEWSARYNLPKNLLSRRLRRGWSIPDCLLTPIGIRPTKEKIEEVLNGFRHKQNG